MQTAADQLAAIEEAVRVYGWRSEQLAALADVHGNHFTTKQIKKLADSGCDLHEVAAMLAVGCTIPLAYEICS